ncbi:ArsR family transcriptional regulator [Thermolongibacillus altinsuensis]|jgi:ArsR family transcriptional regulator|uniref:ArsR family transcriptional regulator n=1 Tax=Thermolongibacillus altinsuensis TaxID=575256 RepID=A0A4R1QI85_9BACL|nr:metalloregulator ArsR/SmtB family transcription factor [Thermolongibacillus altinsuensis]TCL53309.1 ArsR family transcriptional regulator [Thermolongibacillus altinsuensis]GMB07993.1 transcriptional regulator [Thermolongibacillus altinsuensis]
MSEKAMELFRACIPLFQTLSDPHRQDIILLLAEHEALTVNEITEHSRLSRPAISHHLKILRDAGLVKVEQKGTQRYYLLSLDNAVQLLKQLIQSVEQECL